ncbi:splicing regulator RBM11-like isoform X3 [Mobula hypostoma]|uniref:splicing regulator RBM11-like isoform X3 n=1 Tax=Mobula hypostoma TaxID=723540 RepID=UPI002FC30CD6
MSKQEEADRTIFVGNLDSGTREEILYELFLQAGPLTKVHIAKDKDGRQKTYGFVCFKHTESVPYAITLLNGIRLYGRPLNLQYRSGSSHTADASVPYPGADSTLCRTPQDNCRENAVQAENKVQGHNEWIVRSPQFPDGPSSSLFLTPPYSMSNSFNNPDPYYWQAMGFPQHSMKARTTPKPLTSTGTGTRLCRWSAASFRSTASGGVWTMRRPLLRETAA